MAKSHAGVLETDSAAIAVEKLRRAIEAVIPPDQTASVLEATTWTGSEPLLDLLEHIADTLESSSVLILCPARPELLDSCPAWGAGKQNATALNLQPLGRQESRRLVVTNVNSLGAQRSAAGARAALTNRLREIRHLFSSSVALPQAGVAVRR